MDGYWKEMVRIRPEPSFAVAVQSFRQTLCPSIGMGQTICRTCRQGSAPSAGPGGVAWHPLAVGVWPTTRRPRLLSIPSAGTKDVTLGGRRLSRKIIGRSSSSDKEASRVSGAGPQPGLAGKTGRSPWPSSLPHMSSGLGPGICLWRVALQPHAVGVRPQAILAVVVSIQARRRTPRLSIITRGTNPAA